MDKQVDKNKRYVRQSQLADLCGVRPSTVKYYSELGILPYLQHGARLSRLYDEEVAGKRLREIAELKKGGKSINEIIEIFLIN